MPLTTITPEQFAAKSWKRNTDYAFAARANVLPVSAAELSHLVPAMPLGFVQADAAFQLVALAALQRDENFFVAPDGRWIGDYVPATLRAHPFRLLKPQDRDESVLCFDTDSGLLMEAGQGMAFFDEAGAPAQAVKDLLGFLAQIESSRTATQAAVDALQSAGLIQSWPLNLRQGEQTLTVDGLYRIDEAGLNALPDEGFLLLRKAGALPLAYAQLLSMNQLSKLQQAAALQAKLREQARAASQAPGIADLGFRMSEGGTFKFS